MRSNILVDILLLCLTIIYRVGAIYGEFSGPVLFSRSIENFQKLRMFPGVSIAKCEKKCRRRQRCQGFIYNRRAAVCVLTSMLPGGQTDFSKIGIGNVTCFSHAKKCSEPACEWEETCTMKRKRGNTCKIKECGLPPSIYTNVHGNMYAVGNTIVINFGSDQIAVTCAPDGMWKSHNSQCLPGWRRFENSCYYLDLKKRQREDASVFCENTIRSAHLIDVNSESEDMFMTEWLKEEKGVEIVWLGGTYHTEIKQYYWSDGTAFGDGYLSWHPDEPNSPHEHCVAALLLYDYDWADAQCDYLGVGLCEFETP